MNLTLHPLFSSMSFIFLPKLFVRCVGCFQFHCSAMYLQKSFRAAVLKDKDHLVGKPTTECLAVSKTVCFQICPDMALLCHFRSNWGAQKKENHEDLISGMMEGSAKGFGVVWSEEGGAEEWDVHCGEPPQREAGDSHRGNCRNKSPGTVCHNLEYHDNDTNIFQRSISTLEECVL